MLKYIDHYQQTEQQNVQTMPYTLPAGFTQFKDNKAVDQKLVDKALYRRAGYPVVGEQWSNSRSQQCAFSRVSAEW